MSADRFIMALKKIKKFDRGDRVLFIDKATGEKWRVPKDSKRPGMARRAVNYVTASAAHIKAGKPKADAETVAARFEICKNCPSKLFELLAPESIPSRLEHLPIVGTCTHKSCGCYLHGEANGKDKLSWADQKCPRGHWPRVDIVSSVECTKKGCC
jgi:hypothetical protein